MTSDSLERNRFGMLFVMVARRWRETLDTKLAEVGLTDASWCPLVHIGRSGGGLSQKELAARIGIDQSSLVRLLDILVEKGLIERRQDREDRRVNSLFLTEAGSETMGGIQQMLDKVERQLLSDFDNTAMANLVHAIERIDSRIKEMREIDGATP